MSLVASSISDFSTNIWNGQDLYDDGSLDYLSHQGMLTERQDPPAPRYQPLRDSDASIDTDDTTEMPPWLMDVLPRLAELAALQENWDSYGSPPPSPKLIGEALAIVQRAERLLGYSQASPMPTPSIVPLSGGGIQIEWQTPVQELELEFFEERCPAALAVNIATGASTEYTFDANDCNTVSTLLARVMSQWL